MKPFYTLLFLMLLLKTNAQTPIIPLLQDNCCRQGVYYKDTFNDYDNFVGTWKYENDGKIFTVVFQKKTRVYVPEDNNYIDALVGEYKYSENGVELVNTLANLNIAGDDLFAYNITGDVIDNNDPAHSRGIDLRFNDPERSYLNIRIVIRRVFDILPAKMKMTFRGSMSILPDEDSPKNIRVPGEQYILTKVN